MYFTKRFLKSNRFHLFQTGTTLTHANLSKWLVCFCLVKVRNQFVKGGQAEMTSNQIAYANYVESRRHNEATETETNRANVAREVETHRSNVAVETETARHNLAFEAETNRHNVAVEKETHRANKANEAIGWYNASTNRMNAQTNAYAAATQARNVDSMISQREVQNWATEQNVKQGYQSLDIQGKNAYTNERNADTNRYNAVTERGKAISSELRGWKSAVQSDVEGFTKTFQNIARNVLGG